MSNDTKRKLSRNLSLTESGTIISIKICSDADGRSSLVPLNGAPMFRMLSTPAEQHKKRRDLAALSAAGYRQPLLAKKYDRNCEYNLTKNIFISNCFQASSRPSNARCNSGTMEIRRTKFCLEAVPAEDAGDEAQHSVVKQEQNQDEESLAMRVRSAEEIHPIIKHQFHTHI